jgi:transcriptional regulator with XRE-family HTH domain
MKIRYQLRNYRLQKHYTQQAMAETIGISRQQYSNIENGKTEKISAENKKKLAELLNMPEELMDSMDVIVYTKNDGEHYSATNTGNINLSNNEKLIESIIEQNKALTILIQKMSDKLF